MKDKLQAIREEALKQIRESNRLDKLNEVRVSFLGKKGELTAVLKGMKNVDPKERPFVGQMVNETREAIEEFLEETKKKLEEKAREEKMKQEVIDVTLPAKKINVGHRHPNTIALEEVERIFVGMGYEVVEGPFRQTIRQKMSRIHSISIKISCFVPRLLRYRPALWNRANCRSV